MSRTIPEVRRSFVRFGFRAALARTLFGATRVVSSAIGNRRPGPRRWTDMGVAAMLAAVAWAGCAEPGQPNGAPPTSSVSSAQLPSAVTARTAAAPTAALPSAPTSDTASRSAASPSAVASGGTTPSSAAPQRAAPPTAPVPTVGADVALVVPGEVAASAERRPFVLLLHGYQGSGASIARHFGLAELAAARRFVWAAPDGARDSKGQRFWNTGPACCDFERSGVDHVAQLSGLLDRARADSHVDPGQVVVVGYSNGGFMAHRLACEVDGVVAVGSIAGSPPTDLSGCKNRPAVVLQVHGDADRVVRFTGGHVLDKDDVAPHPGPVAGLVGWARRLGCPVAARPIGRLDLEAALDGEETERLQFGPCDATIELWRVAGGGHDIVANRDAFARILNALLWTKP